MFRQTNVKSKYLLTFCLAFFTAAIIFLPFVIYDQGYFTFLGDFNVQQIPFYRLAHEAVRSGNIYWSWLTDLGANFIGSYSFYLLGSPFFYLTLLFPNAAVPYLMAPLLCLKIGIMAVTSYAYFKRFVKNQDYAILGAMLYAFSGFSIYNIFFNHFHDVMALFPLLLLGLEAAVVDDRKGLFAAAVFLNATVNYFFFVGEVVFVVAYYFCRLSCPDFNVTVRKFFMLAFESIVGFGLSMILLLPSILVALSNPRTHSYMNGWDLLLYWEPQRYPAILQSFLFPPDLPSRPNFFPDSGVKWMSVAAWLPLFSMTGVFAYIKAKKKKWLKRLVCILLVTAFIPGLNAFFYLFNTTTYSRWFYMLTFVFALCSIKALEDESVDLRSGFKLTAILTGVISLAIGLVPVVEDGELSFGLSPVPGMMWVYTAIAALSLVAMGYVIYCRRQKQPGIAKLATVFVLVISFVYGFTYIFWGKAVSNDSKFIIEQGIHGAEKIDLPDDSFYRVDVYEGMDNQAMFWMMPNIQTFHSIVPASLMEYFPSVGVTRDVGSRPDPEEYPLRGFLSVRYLFVDQRKNTEPNMPGFEYYDTQNGFNIYENQYFVPMGFTYDYYCDADTYESVSEEMRQFLNLKAIYLSEEQIAKYGGFLEELHNSELPSMTEEEYFADCIDRAASSAYEFSYDNTGFTAKIVLQQENLVFFTVPYEEGWSVTVNGEPAEVEKVNVGFMAVYCPAGDNTIRFEYETPGLKLGALISLVCLILLVIYVVIFLLYDHAQRIRREEELERQELEQPSVRAQKKRLAERQREQLSPPREGPQPSEDTPPPAAPIPSSPIQPSSDPKASRETDEVIDRVMEDQQVAEILNDLLIQDDDEEDTPR